MNLNNALLFVIAVVFDLLIPPLPCTSWVPIKWDQLVMGHREPALGKHPNDPPIAVPCPIEEQWQLASEHRRSIGKKHLRMNP